MGFLGCNIILGFILMTNGEMTKLANLEYQRRFRDKMKRNGFTQRMFWIHDDDYDAVKAQLTKLRRDREREIEEGGFY